MEELVWRRPYGSPEIYVLFETLVEFFAFLSLHQFLDVRLLFEISVNLLTERADLFQIFQSPVGSV